MNSTRPATDNTIARLTHIWQNLLNVRPIGPDQDYFELGGDSLFVVELLTQVEQEFGIALPLASFFDATTIRELTQIIVGEKTVSR